MKIFNAIPKSWKIYSLPDLLFFQEGPGVRNWQFTEHGVKILNVRNISEGKINLNTTSIFISDDEAYGKYAHFLADAGDLVIASSGIVVDNFHNKIAFIEEEHLPLCMNTSTIRFKVQKQSLLDINFFRLFLGTKFFKSQLKRLITGSAQLNFGPSHLKQIKIPLPALEDQRGIAHLLSKMEGLIARRKQHLKQLDDLLKSVFLEMFGDPVRNEKGWEKPILKEFGKILTGNTPPRKDPSNYSSQHIEWVKTDNISSDAICISQATEYLSEIGVNKARTITKGALMVACIAGSVESIGRAALTNRTVAFNQQINAVQPKKDVNPFYLYVLFKISKAYIQSHASKGMKKILTKGDFEKITMIKPPIDIQNKFGAIVEKVEDIKSRYRKSLADLEQLYGALSQKAFKGELDLSHVPLPIEEPDIPGEEKLEAEDIQPTAPSFELPEPASPASLTSPEGRETLLNQWLIAWLEQPGKADFSAQSFMDTARERMWELAEDEAPGWGVAEYDQLKAWVFEALEKGRLIQSYDNAENRVRITAAKE